MNKQQRDAADLEDRLIKSLDSIFASIVAVCPVAAGHAPGNELRGNAKGHSLAPSIPAVARPR